MATRRLKLAKASANILTDPEQSGILFTTDVDYMELPSKFKDLIKMCRFFYKHDPIAGTVLNKMVDCAISPLMNQRANCTDEECAVYDSLEGILNEFYRNVCLEYLLSGLVIPHYEWVRISGAKLTDRLDSRTRIWVPDNIWFRDPATITIKNSPIPNKKYIYVKIDAETVSFIKSGGKRKDGTYDKETYQALVDNYPEFVNAIMNQRGTNLEILLTDTRPIFGRTLPEDPYPIPYMENALEALMHKRNLRKMDYAIAARVTAAIQLIQLGDVDFPCTDDKDFDHIKTQMNYQTSKGKTERIFQLFANHTLKITWVAPDTAAMLNREKYASVDEDIIAGFGFPRTLITGETMRSNVEGGSDLATFSPIATMEAIRTKLISWTKDLYEEIRDKNRYRNSPIPQFMPMRLYSIVDLNNITRDLYREGSLSRKTRLELQNLDQATEMERIAQEDQEYKENNIREAPFVPFSSPGGGFGRSEEAILSALASLPPDKRAEHYTPLEDFEYLIHHVETDERGKENIHHCLLYDHIANMYTQGHLVFSDGKAYLDGKEIDKGRFHVITGLEPDQEVVWSDEEAEEVNIKPKKMHSGMTKKEKAKEW